MSRWRLIDSGHCGAYYNMALDEALARGVMEGSAPVLRFYGWDVPSVSLGCFQRAEDVDRDYAAASGIPVVRRITGGRGILHGPEELTYSFSASGRWGEAFSAGLRECYAMIGAAFVDALAALGLDPVSSADRRPGGGRSPLCFHSASVGEIKISGRKVIGSAQKRWQGGYFMQQGSIPLRIDYPALKRVFGLDGGVDAAGSMVGLQEVSPSLTLEALKDSVARAFERVFGVEFVKEAPAAEEQAAAAGLAAKYASPEWNLRRHEAPGAS